MADVSFIPLNKLEKLLIETTGGHLAFANFLKAMMDVEVHVLSSTEVDQDGTGFQPLLFDREPGTLLAVFTARERGMMFSDRLPFCLTLTGRQLFKRIPPGFGIVLNPGSTAGFELPPEGVQDIRRDFISTAID